MPKEEKRASRSASQPSSIGYHATISIDGFENSRLPYTFSFVPFHPIQMRWIGGSAEHVPGYPRWEVGYVGTVIYLNCVRWRRWRLDKDTGTSLVERGDRREGERVWLDSTQLDQTI